MFFSAVGTGQTAALLDIVFHENGKLPARTFFIEAFDE